LLLVGSYPTQRAAWVPLLAQLGLDVDEASDVRSAHQRGRASYAGWIVFVQSVSDLASASHRARGSAAPMLVVAPRADAAIANRAQLIDAQCVFGADIARNVRAFAERVLAARHRGPTPEVLARAFAGSAHLPRRQHDLLVHVAAGVPRTELRVVMGVTENTVKSLVRSVLRVFELRNIDVLRAAILRRGPVGPSSRAQRS
jgi:DNA-binding CsgD family transcriptional regulator